MRCRSPRASPQGRTEDPPGGGRGEATQGTRSEPAATSGDKRRRQEAKATNQCRCALEAGGSARLSTRKSRPPRAHVERRQRPFPCYWHCNGLEVTGYFINSVNSADHCAHLQVTMEDVQAVHMCQSPAELADWSSEKTEEREREREKGREREREKQRVRQHRKTTKWASKDVIKSRRLNASFSVYMSARCNACSSGRSRCGDELCEHGPARRARAPALRTMDAKDQAQPPRPPRPPPPAGVP